MVISAYETALRSNTENIIHVGCLAHVRRKFFEASKVSKKTGGAQAALNKIRKIYHEYNTIRDTLGDTKTNEQGILDELDMKVVPLL